MTKCHSEVSEIVFSVNYVSQHTKVRDFHISLERTNISNSRLTKIPLQYHPLTTPLDVLYCQETYRVNLFFVGRALLTRSRFDARVSFETPKIIETVALLRQNFQENLRKKSEILAALIVTSL